MNNLHKALDDISSMRRQMARATEFRGYGPATLASTAALAGLACVAQSRWVVRPQEHLGSYLTVWIWTALASAALIGIQMQTRSRRLHSGLADEMIRMAVEQFLPSAIAGALTTLVLVRYAPQAAWMLPGLWQVIFSLGVFSSCRFLPRPMLAAGVWYMATGLACLSFGDARALSPWTMGLSYGFGQLLVAGILYFKSNEAKDND